MTDTIFRGKRLDNGEWVVGSLVAVAGRRYILPSNVPNGERLLFRYHGEGSLVGTLAIGGFFEVDPKTVGQETWVKDTNGRQMFEDDIVRTGNVTVLIRKQKTRVAPINKEGRPVSWGLVQLGVVIGNKHDNPDLVRGW